MRTLRLAVAIAGLALASMASAVSADDIKDVSGYHADEVALQIDAAPADLCPVTVASTETVQLLAAAATLTSYTSPRLDRRLSIGTMTARTWALAGDEPLPSDPELSKPAKPNRLV